MNPQSDQKTDLNLPQPSPANAAGDAIPGLVGGDTPDSSQSPPMPVVSVSSTGRQTGYETNVIDQEWIDRAKEIVERTHADPYLQSKEISQIKAQYIKARYNKDIKKTEE